MKQDVLNENISDELLGCFIDNELDTEEHQQILQAQLKYPALQKRVCELRQLKQLVKSARPAAPLHMDNTTKSLGDNKYYVAAAAVMLIITGAVFTAMYQHFEQNSAPQNQVAYANPLLKSVMDNSATNKQTNIVVHVNKTNSYNMDVILNDIKNVLIESRKNNTPVRIEVVTSGPGLYLLSALQENSLNTINKLYTQFGNVSFVVCQKTLDVFRDKTHQLNSIPKAMVLTASATELIKLRQAQGWKYVPI